MATNSTLNKAKDAKNDEFYTQITDIEKELKNYKEHFENATVFCNCDDPEYSNFWKYFHLNFKALGLKKLVTTHYDAIKPTYKMEYEGGNDNDISEGKITKLKQNGDFRSDESIELLKEATIVVTNPPFSLLREYIAQLVEYEKSFLILSNPNALHYKEIFPLVRDNKIWLGYKSMSTDMLFDVKPEFAEWLVENKKPGSGYRIVEGVVKGRAQAIWITNLDIQKRHEMLDLIEKYSEDKYLNYDNFDAINIDKVYNIPVDYKGMMGVPDSFLEYYNPEQFDIIGLGSGDIAKEIGVKRNYRGRSDLAYTKNGKSSCPYSRIIIKRKDVQK